MYPNINWSCSLVLYFYFLNYPMKGRWMEASKATCHLYPFMGLLHRHWTWMVVHYPFFSQCVVLLGKFMSMFWWISGHPKHLESRAIPNWEYVICTYNNIIIYIYDNYIYNYRSIQDIIRYTYIQIQIFKICFQKIHGINRELVLRISCKTSVF